jgi:hypothetical protein
MIDYSIPKNHVLCGHFIQINSEAEYIDMSNIARECGFSVINSFAKADFHFRNSKEVSWLSRRFVTGQEITLPELRELAMLSKLTFPMEMYVSCNDYFEYRRENVQDFYKGQPVIKTNNAGFYTAKYYHLPNSKAGEIERLEKEIQERQDQINKLKQIK